MVHRDIKPGNIMFDSDERVVLTDFGIARIIGNQKSITDQAAMVGTPAYMSPEQGLGESGDHRSDIYSLGIVLYQLTTGTIPFNADTPIGTVLKHINDTVPPPSARNPSLTQDLEEIIYKSLAKSPSDRFQSAADMAEALQTLESQKQARQLQLVDKGIRDKNKYDELANVTTKSHNSSRNQHGCWMLILLSLLAVAAIAGGIYAAYTGLLNNYLPIVQ